MNLHETFTQYTSDYHKHSVSYKCQKEILLMTVHKFLSPRMKIEQPLKRKGRGCGFFCGQLRFSSIFLFFPLTDNEAGREEGSFFKMVTVL